MRARRYARAVCRLSCITAVARLGLWQMPRYSESRCAALMQYDPRQVNPTAQSKSKGLAFYLLLSACREAVYLHIRAGLLFTMAVI